MLFIIKIYTCVMRDKGSIISCSYNRVQPCAALCMGLHCMPHLAIYHYQQLLETTNGLLNHWSVTQWAPSSSEGLLMSDR